MLLFKAVREYFGEWKTEHQKGVFHKKHPSPEERFLKEVMKQIHYPFDRAEIYQELKDHLKDRAEFEQEQGLAPEEGMAVAVASMGDPKELGRELNREHNFLLGILWILVRLVMIPLLIISLFTAVFPLVMLTGMSAFYAVFPPGRDHIPKEEIVYEINDLNEKIQIDKQVIEFTDLIYREDGTLYVYYKSYWMQLGFPRWSYIPAPSYEDEDGNGYHGGGFRSAGIVSYCYDTLKNFPADAEVLTIFHQERNISYEFEVPLPGREEGTGVGE